jgi:hypothetical protein
LPGNPAVNVHPQQWEPVFSLGHTVPHRARCYAALL